MQFGWYSCSCILHVRLCICTCTCTFFLPRNTDTYYRKKLVSLLDNDLLNVSDLYLIMSCPTRSIYGPGIGWNFWPVPKTRAGYRPIFYLKPNPKFVQKKIRFDRTWTEPNRPHVGPSTWVFFRNTIQMKNTHIHPRISTSINTCKQPHTYEHLQETLGLTILLSVSLPFEMEFQLKNILMNSKKKIRGKPWG